MAKKRKPEPVDEEPESVAVPLDEADLPATILGFRAAKPDGEG